MKKRTGFLGGFVLKLLVFSSLALLTGCMARKEDSSVPAQRISYRQARDSAFWHKDNARVARFKDLYRKNGLPEILWGRAQPYLPYIQEVFDSHNLPRELCLLPMVESGFRTEVRSGTRALGMWQFIPETAQRMGLVVGRTRDDRADWKKSTEAAARYLVYLGEKFDRDWGLVLAAYNSGPDTVRRAIEEQGEADYWKLQLREEAMNYVPRFLAMIHILRDELTSA